MFLPSENMRGKVQFTGLLALLCAMLFSVPNGQAQDPKYNRMLEDLVDGKYERVLFRAIGFTEKEATKKHPEPYAYMARAYLLIHQSDDPALKESYPKALKESLKYCTKFIKKDKEGEYVPDLLDFIEDLRAEKDETIAKCKERIKTLRDDLDDARASHCGGCRRGTDASSPAQ